MLIVSLAVPLPGATSPAVKPSLKLGAGVTVRVGVSVMAGAVVLVAVGVSVLVLVGVGVSCAPAGVGGSAQSSNKRRHSTLHPEKSRLYWAGRWWREILAGSFMVFSILSVALWSVMVRPWVGANQTASGRAYLNYAAIIANV